MNNEEAHGLGVGDLVNGAEGRQNQQALGLQVIVGDDLVQAQRVNIKEEVPSPIPQDLDRLYPAEPTPEREVPDDLDAIGMYGLIEHEDELPRREQDQVPQAPGNAVIPKNEAHQEMEHNNGVEDQQAGNQDGEQVRNQHVGEQPNNQIEENRIERADQGNDGAVVNRGAVNARQVKQEVIEDQELEFPPQMQDNGQNNLAVQNHVDNVVQNHVGNFVQNAADNVVQNPVDHVEDEVLLNIPNPLGMFPPEAAWTPPNRRREIELGNAKPPVDKNRLDKFIGALYQKMDNGEELHLTRIAGLLRGYKFDEESLDKIIKLMFQTAMFADRQINAEMQRQANDMEDDGAVDRMSALQAALLKPFNIFASWVVTCDNEELEHRYRRFVLVLVNLTRFAIDEAARSGNHAMYEEKADAVAHHFRLENLESNYASMCCFYLIYRHFRMRNLTFENKVTVAQSPNLGFFADNETRYIYYQSLPDFNYVNQRSLAKDAENVKKRRKNNEAKYKAIIICCVLDDSPISYDVWKALVACYKDQIGQISKTLQYHELTDPQIVDMCKKFHNFISDLKVFKAFKTDQICFAEQRPGPNGQFLSFHLDYLYLYMIGMDAFRLGYSLSHKDDVMPIPDGTDNEVYGVGIDAANATFYLRYSLQFPAIVREAMTRIGFAFDTGLPSTWNNLHYIFTDESKETKAALSAVKRNQYFKVLDAKYKAHPFYEQYQEYLRQIQMNNDNQDGRLDDQGRGERMGDDFEDDDGVGDALVADRAPRARRQQNMHHRRAFNEMMTMYQDFATNPDFRFEVDDAPIPPIRRRNNVRRNEVRHNNGRQNPARRSGTSQNGGRQNGARTNGGRRNNARGGIARQNTVPRVTARGKNTRQNDDRETNARRNNIRRNNVRQNNSRQRNGRQNDARESIARRNAPRRSAPRRNARRSNVQEAMDED